MSTKDIKNFFFDHHSPLHLKFFSIILSLLPFFVITGPAIPDISISLLALYFIIISILEKNFTNYLKNYFCIFFLVFCLYGLLRSLFSDFPLNSLTQEGSAFYFRYLFFSLAVVMILKRNPKIYKSLLWISLICAIIISVDGFYQFYKGVNILGFEKYGRGDRLTGFFNDEPIIGRYIAHLIPIVVSLIYYVYGIKKKIVYLTILILIFSEVFIFLSGERAAFFFIVFYNVLIFIFIPKVRIIRIIGIFISFLLIIFLADKSETVKSRMITETLGQISETKLKFLPYSEHHEQHYVSSLKMFKDNILFGQGTNLYRYICSDERFIYKDRSCSSHPHNFYIQILAEQGIIGAIFISSFYLWITFISLKIFINLSFKKKNYKLENPLFLIILITFWWPLIPHQSFYNNWNNILIFLPLGFFLKDYFFKNIN